MLEPESIGSNRQSALFLLELILEDRIVSHADDFLGFVDEITHGYLLLLSVPRTLPVGGVPFRRKNLDKVNFRPGQLPLGFLVVHGQSHVGNHVAPRPKHDRSSPG